MFQIKLAAAIMMPLAFFSSIAAAQELQQNCLVNTQQPVPLKDSPYGPFIPYTGAPLEAIPQQCSAVSSAPSSESRKDESSVSHASSVVPTSSVITPKCEPPPTPRKDEVYGKYTPYTGPLLGLAPPRCEVASVVPTANNAPDAQPMFSNTPPLDLSAAQGEPSAGSVKSTAPSPFKPALSAANDPAIAPSPTPGEPTSRSEYIRSVPSPRAATIPQEIRPFRSLAIGFKADTLGLGIEFATPMAYKINLRSSVNFLAFNDPFNIDGVDYDARLNLRSSETTVDWFPRGEGGFHISPGILYANNTMSAPASVGPGQTFVLGTQSFINSVDDPVRGTSSVVYPHKFSPMLLIGYGNIIPRVRRHFTIPVELGVAYTGAPLISVALNGTACTTDGCVNFGGNAQAQTFLKQEVHNLNEDLKRYPVFPILSLGFAYHF